MCQVSVLFENGILVPRISFLSSTSDVFFQKSISNLDNEISGDEMEILDFRTRTWSLVEKMVLPIVATQSMHGRLL